MVLGNITIGDGCKIAAGSVVLTSLPSHSTAAGVPAKIVGLAKEEEPGSVMDQNMELVSKTFLYFCASIHVNGLLIYCI